ncbi:MAG: YebG family protein [Colwellia sp.]|nr:YebG family protein [Colwellia sp.]
MAVENRFVVIRHGVEVQTFMEKKAADEYDKMLDMADNLTEMLKSVPFELSDDIKEELSIYLAKNREDVLIALQAKKAKAPSSPPKEAPPKAAVKTSVKAAQKAVVKETVKEKVAEKTKKKSAAIKEEA